MKKFAGIEDKFAGSETSEIYLQPVPYDGTSTWGKGADKGFAAFMEASENMELYDIETDSEVYRKGIHTLPLLKDFKSPEDMFSKVYNRTSELLKKDKFLTFFGGEHSISIGIIKAFSEFYTDLSILHLDAHADLRAEYNGTPYSHACALYQASKNIKLVQAGIRSMDISEKEFLDPSRTFFSHDIYNNDEWMNTAVSLLSENVYITLDLDVLDPSIMPSTGTPEPGGMDWYQLLDLLRKVFTNKNVAGFDIVELAPSDANKAPDFAAAKLYYKMLSYKFHGGKNG